MSDRVTTDEIMDAADRTIAGLKAEVTRLRSILDRCHEAVGEDAGSDDETLPQGVAERVAALTRLRAEVREAEARGLERGAELSEEHGLGCRDWMGGGCSDHIERVIRSAAAKLREVPR